MGMYRAVEHAPFLPKGGERSRSGGAPLLFEAALAQNTPVAHLNILSLEKLAREMDSSWRGRPPAPAVGRFFFLACLLQIPAVIVESARSAL